jgi:hypothetical protein
MLFLNSLFVTNDAKTVTSQYALRLKRGSASFAEATGKSSGQWNQLIHYPIPVVSERSEVTTGNQFSCDTERDLYCATRCHLL